MRNISDEHAMHEAMRLAKTPAGQQLIRLLQSNDNGALQQAMEQVNSGNYAAAKEMLQDLFSSEEARKLIQELGR